MLKARLCFILLKVHIIGKEQMKLIYIGLKIDYIVFLTLIHKSKITG